MFSNWNINLLKPLIWPPQWRITKYFMVSDLLKFYSQLPLCVVHCAALFKAHAEPGWVLCLLLVPRILLSTGEGLISRAYGVNRPLYLHAHFFLNPHQVSVVRGNPGTICCP